MICDSIQEGDCPVFQVILDNFPINFHEPYFTHYTTDNLDERLEKAGFEILKIETHFAGKYWLARKPQVD